MKKILFISLFALTAGHAVASTPWWRQETICRLDTTSCYRAMGAGYDEMLWDANAGCRGMKKICPIALIADVVEPQPVGRTEISRGDQINDDFDISVLNTADDCFGMRRTSANGTRALLDGELVNVWCAGVLDTPDEQVGTGEITYGAQPTCAELAERGYIAVVKNRCYGAPYDTSKYFIECAGTSLTPTRLIVLNGAEYTTSAGQTPVDEAAAAKLFDTMESVSKNQRTKYY